MTYPNQEIATDSEEFYAAVNDWMEVLTETWAYVQTHYYEDTSLFEERLTAARLRVAEAGWREAARRANRGGQP